MTTQVFNKLTLENFAAKTKEANLRNKADIDDFAEKINFDNNLKNLNEKFTLTNNIAEIA